jgi:pimeloyl-ACP methyl ester carboxylesterase
VSRRPGPGARVVLVHGAMDRAGGFAKVLRRAPELDIIRYDRRGYGGSRGGPLAETIDDHIADLETVIGDQPSVVVGHSLGGVFALAVAARRPDIVTSVGAFEAPLPWSPLARHSTTAAMVTAAVRPGEPESPEAMAETFLRRMIGNEVWERFPTAMQRDRRDEGHALVAEIRAMRAGHAIVDPADIAVPVVAGLGDRSSPRHIEAAQILAACAPVAELFVIEGAGHAAQFTHPDEFVAFLRRVVERARAGR